MLLLSFAVAMLLSAQGTMRVAAQEGPTVDVPGILYFPKANSRPTYFTIHNEQEAWAISKGAGVKVGILDQSFGYEIHKDLYSGGKNFQKGDSEKLFNRNIHHGYWMASTLREIAPDVEIYALGTSSSDESDKAGAMVQAID